MKNAVYEFLRRGIAACGFGPLILAVVYLILQRNGVIESLSVNTVCVGIFSLSALAFIAGGINVIYQIERLPLMAAIAIHGGILYSGYLITYLLNDWLDWGRTPILVFTAIFLFGYLAIWLIIYAITKKRTDKLNKTLEKRQGAK